MTVILFAEAPTAGKAVEILRPGTFTDMSGREVKITAADLDKFISNFQADAAGQQVPVDVDHRREEAAGWIIELTREGDKLLARVDWNELGKQLVGDKIYKYISATIDLTKKTIRSISLVNFPAVKGLAPVELAEGVYRFEEDKSLKRLIINSINETLAAFGLPSQQTTTEVTMSGESTPTPPVIDREAIKAELRAEMEAELTEREQTVTQLREEVRAEVEATLKAQYERRIELAEFADGLCNGEAALSAKPDEVVDFLASLDDEQLKMAKSLLQSKVVDFSERGSSGDGQPTGEKLPDYAIADIKAGRITVAELFKAQAVAGKAADYDLSEFSEAQLGEAA